MARRLPLILLVLGWMFWFSPTLAGIASGVAVFLFGMMALEQGLRGLTGVLGMVPLINPLVRLLETKMKPTAVKLDSPKDISMTMLETPGAAMEAIRRELLRLFWRVWMVWPPTPKLATLILIWNSRNWPRRSRKMTSSTMAGSTSSFATARSPQPRPLR